MTDLLVKHATVELPVKVRDPSIEQDKRFRPISRGFALKRWTKGTMRVLDNVNLKISRGDRLAVVGANGSGKTTLLRVLAGLMTPSSGYVFHNASISCLINVTAGLDMHASGHENVALRGALLGRSNLQIQDDIEEVSVFSDLNEFMGMPLSTFSSGMIMRLAFAMSTLESADILLLDEWLSVGDESFQLKATQRLDTLISSSNILVLASHSRELLERNCNRAIWMEQGKVVMDDSCSEVLARYFAD